MEMDGRQACQIGKCVRIDPFQWILIQMKNTNIPQGLKGPVDQMTKSIETQIEFLQGGQSVEVFRGEMCEEIVRQGEIPQRDQIQQGLGMEMFDSILVQDQSTAKGAETTKDTSVERSNAILAQTDLLGLTVLQVVKEVVLGEIARVDARDNGHEVDEDRLMVEGDFDRHRLLGGIRLGRRVVVEKGSMGSDAGIRRTPLHSLSAEAVEVRGLDEQGVDPSVGEDRLGNDALEIDGVEEETGDRRSVEDLAVCLKEHFAPGGGMCHDQLTEIGVSEGVIVKKEMFHGQAKCSGDDIDEGQTMHGDVVIHCLEGQVIVGDDRPAMLRTDLCQRSTSESGFVDQRGKGETTDPLTVTFQGQSEQITGSLRGMDTPIERNDQENQRTKTWLTSGESPLPFFTSLTRVMFDSTC